MKLMLILFMSSSFLGLSQQFIPYQAVVRDAGGLVMTNTQLDIEISLFTDIFGSSTDYHETFQIATSNFGVINLNIGSGQSTSSGLYSSIDSLNWSNTQYYINVQLKEVSDISFIDLGTTSFSWVPYAIHSKSSSQKYSVSGLEDVDTVNLEVGQTLIWNGSQWINGYIDSVDYATYSESSTYSDTTLVALSCLASFADTSMVSINSDSSVYADTALFANSSQWSSKSDTASYTLNALNSWDLNGNTINSGDFIGTINSTDLVFMTDSVERMRITNDGKIGLGTDTPVMDFEMLAENGMALYAPLGSGTSRTFTGNRMVWYPKKAYFYTGGASVNWTDSHKGNYSAATGYNSYAKGNYSFATGSTSYTKGDYSFAGGDQSNTQVGGDYGFAFGYQSSVGGECAVGMGRDARSNGASSIALGYHPRALGAYSVAIGYQVEAHDTSSFAFGYRSKSLHKGSFVFADQSTSTGFFESTGPNQFLVRASNGTFFYSSSDQTTGVQLPAGSGSWSSLSDSTMKKNINILDPSNILSKLKDITVYEWSYKAQNDSVVHVGPMSQDFKAAFGYGESDRMISTVDIDGVNMAALKGLIDKTNELEVKLNDYDELKQKYEALLNDKQEVLKLIEELENSNSEK